MILANTKKEFTDDYFGRIFILTWVQVFELAVEASDDIIIEVRFSYNTFGGDKKYLYGTLEPYNDQGSDPISLIESEYDDGEDEESGDASHAEGVNTTASGYASHAEGSGTTASGYCSHSEGASTDANHYAQHVFGEFNVIDSSTAESNKRGNYVEIVGNGTADNYRSNARTLDWSGNESLAGGLTLGKGTADEVTITAAQLKALLALLNT